jgi:hypothetical protein
MISSQTEVAPFLDDCIHVGLDCKSCRSAAFTVVLAACSVEFPTSLPILGAGVSCLLVVRNVVAPRDHPLNPSYAEIFNAVLGEVCVARIPILRERSGRLVGKLVVRGACENVILSLGTLGRNLIALGVGLFDDLGYLLAHSCERHRRRPRCSPR